VVPGEVRDDNADIGYVFGKAVVAEDAGRLVASPTECWSGKRGRGRRKRTGSRSGRSRGGERARGAFNRCSPCVCQLSETRTEDRRKREGRTPWHRAGSTPPPSASGVVSSRGLDGPTRAGAAGPPALEARGARGCPRVRRRCPDEVSQAVPTSWRRKREKSRATLPLMIITRTYTHANSHKCAPTKHLYTRWDE
jgi:hypothetical protein